MCVCVSLFSRGWRWNINLGPAFGRTQNTVEYVKLKRLGLFFIEMNIDYSYPLWTMNLAGQGIIDSYKVAPYQL